MAGDIDVNSPALAPGDTSGSRTGNDSLLRVPRDFVYVSGGIVADASHELRSPLATLPATLDVARNDPSGETWEELSPVLASRARDTGGSGLGLAISREIVRVHGGSVTVDENSHGRRRFTVTLPLPRDAS